jgi:hypothetical protein
MLSRLQALAHLYASAMLQDLDYHQCSDKHLS